jgi:hypothetical protein
VLEKGLLQAAGNFLKYLRGFRPCCGSVVEVDEGGRIVHNGLVFNLEIMRKKGSF